MLETNSLLQAENIPNEPDADNAAEGNMVKQRSTSTPMTGSV